MNDKFSNIQELNQPVIEKIAEELIQRSPLRNEADKALKTALSMLDLTTLEGADNTEKVSALCAKAKGFQALGLPNVAAVCVYPTLVSVAKKELAGSGIHVASVAGAFPSGLSPLPLRLEEVKYAVSEGADEIDMVISRGKFLEGNFEAVFEEVALTKHACGKAHLKVILETGELQSLKNVLIASSIAIAAGADFIKTSTGKMGVGATLPAVFVMMQAVRDHFENTGKKIGIKPSGGVAECEQALDYLCLLKEVLGDEWMTPELFRFGASRLADRLREKLQ